MRINKGKLCHQLVSHGFLVDLSNKEPFSLNFQRSTGIYRIVWIKLTANFFSDYTLVSQPLKRRSKSFVKARYALQTLIYNVTF